MIFLDTQTFLFTFMHFYSLLCKMIFLYTFSHFQILLDTFLTPHSYRPTGRVTGTQSAFRAQAALRLRILRLYYVCIQTRNLSVEVNPPPHHKSNGQARVETDLGFVCLFVCDSVCLSAHFLSAPVTPIFYHGNRKRGKF